MKNQKNMYHEAVKRCAEQDKIFFIMVSDLKNPLTNKELQALIEKRPSVWERYSAYVGKLTD